MKRIIFILLTVSVYNFISDTIPLYGSPQNNISASKSNYVRSFDVKARVLRVDIYGNNSRYTGYVTLTLSVTNNGHVDCTAIDGKRISPLNVEVASLQRNYSFEVHDTQNNICYCFNSSELY